MVLNMNRMVIRKMNQMRPSRKLKTQKQSQRNKRLLKNLKLRQWMNKLLRVLNKMLNHLKSLSL